MRHRSPEPPPGFGERVFVDRDRLLDGFIRGQVVMLGPKLATEPMCEIAQGLGDACFGIDCQRLACRAVTGQRGIGDLDLRKVDSMTAACMASAKVAKRSSSKWVGSPAIIDPTFRSATVKAKGSEWSAAELARNGMKKPAALALGRTAVKKVPGKRGEKNNSVSLPYRPTLSRSFLARPSRSIRAS